MEGVDKEKVQRIVYEMSKGSKYFENEERKDAFIKQKIENMQAQFAKLTASEIFHYQKVLCEEITRIVLWFPCDDDILHDVATTVSFVS